MQGKDYEVIPMKLEVLKVVFGRIPLLRQYEIIIVTAAEEYVHFLNKCLIGDDKANRRKVGSKETVKAVTDEGIFRKFGMFYSVDYSAIEKLIVEAKDNGVYKLIPFVHTKRALDAIEVKLNEYLEGMDSVQITLSDRNGEE